MATARQVDITEEDIAKAKEPRANGTWSEIEVPGDYEITLAAVEDYKTAKSEGWIFIYHVQTSTGPCELKEWVSLGQSARWKLSQIAAAHGITSISILNPDDLVGESIGGHVDWGKDRETGEVSSYREVKEYFALVDAPEDTQPDTPPAL